VVFCARG